jgi:hypothetical protein
MAFLHSNVSGVVSDLLHFVAPLTLGEAVGRSVIDFEKKRGLDTDIL